MLVEILNVNFGDFLKCVR